MKVSTRSPTGRDVPGSLQRFLSIHAATYNSFYHQRHLLKRPMYKQLRSTSFELWQSANVAA